MNRLRLHNILINSGYELNSDKVIIYSNPSKFYYKDGIIIKFFDDRSVIIDDTFYNRKYKFNKNDSNYIISNFIKMLEKNPDKVF